MPRFLLVFTLAAACAAAPVPRSPLSFADLLRAKIAAAEDDVQRGSLRDELAKVELQRAREANTVFAYRRFLSEFPGGPEATTARSLLESVRFEQAGVAGTTGAWLAFLEEHPSGRRTAQARARLGALDIEASLKSTDLTAVRRTLGRYPEHERRPLLAAHEDRLAWEAARAGTAGAIDGYLVAHPAGAFRIEANERRSHLDEADVLASEDLETAKRRARDVGAPQAAVTLRALELQLALRALDLPEIGAISVREASTPGLSRVRDEAASFVASVQRIPLSPELLASVEAARLGAGLRSHDDLVQALRAGDPQERAEAARELAEWGRREDAEHLLEAVESRYVSLRLAAVEALKTLAFALPRAVWSAPAAVWEQDALSHALSAPPWRRIAAIREASGRIEDARAAWQEVLRHDPNDLAGRARLLALDRLTTDRLAQGAAARELAKAAASFGDDRWLKPQDAYTPREERRDGPGETVGVPAEISILRQLCTAIELGGVASSALGGLRLAAGATEQELLGLAIADLDRALVRLRSKGLELERDALRRDPKFVACGIDRVGPRIATSRAQRIAAINSLADLGDRRALAFVDSLARSPSPELRAVVTNAAAKLAAAPAEPPAPIVVVPPTAKPAPPRRSGRPR